MANKLLVAGTIEEAVRLKDSDSAFLAGGTEINRLDSSIEAGSLISIRKLPELTGIRKEGNTVWIGAATTFQQAVESPDVPEFFREACLMMASRTKRNMATVGGNLALRRDDSYLYPALMADRASVICRGKDGINREFCACGYAMRRDKGELADSLILRIGLNTDRCVQLKRFANTAMSHSLLNIAYGCSKTGKDTVICAAIKNHGIHRFDEELSRTLEADPSLSEADIAELVKKHIDFQIPDDMFGSSDYKRYLLGITIAGMAACAR